VGQPELTDASGIRSDCGWEDLMSTTAYIMIETSVGKVNDVATTLRSTPGVTTVDIVIGPYDIIATVSAADMNAVSEVLANHVHKVKGVARTLTCISLNRG
jgi:DNA-binding Lrp family transcriptional regulator